MTSWNYRVVREDDGELTIREVFYGDAEQIIGCAQDPVAITGASIEELLQRLEDVKLALRYPVLSFTDIPSAGEPPAVGSQPSISHAELIAQLGLSGRKRSSSTPKRKAS